MENSSMKLKLNYKRTFIIGFAFFGILMLWQVYNTYCPLFLTDLLVKNNPGTTQTDWQYVVGILMAADNIFALFMLPLFGRLSDKTHTRFGKRMPYIVIGTILSSIVFPLMVVMFYINSLVGVIITMGLTLIFMQMYRNPAVSLMPDVTPKPLRSKANGIINVVGYIGAILGGALALVFSFNKIENKLLLLIPFGITSLSMIITTLVLFLRINENKLAEELKDEMTRGEEESDLQEKIVEDAPLSKKNKISLILLIIAVFLWFASFNSVETFWSGYGVYELNISSYSLFTIILTVASLAAFMPAALLSEKIGRKWTIVIGLALVTAALVGLIFVGKGPVIDAADPDSLNKASFWLFPLFIIAGIGWAFINCCSYPMFVELASGKNIGTYTGIYYAASMLAQSVTPVLAGLLMYFQGAWKILFIYASIVMGLALLVFLFINNVKAKNVKVKKGLEALDVDD